MKIFFDNNLAPGLAESLKPVLSKEHEVSHLREKFPTNTPDAEWLSALAKEGGWIVISGDIGISRKPHEQKAWLESGLVVFFLSKGWTNISPLIQLSKLAKILPRVIETAQNARGEKGFIITPSSNKIDPITVT